MFILRTQNVFRWRIAPTFLLFVMGSVSYGDETSPEKESQESAEAIDEIVVYSEKSIALLRHEVHIAEDKVFSMFNSLNSRDEFDISCSLQRDRDSSLRSRVCRANFYSDIERQAGNRTFIGILNNRSRNLLVEKKRRLRREMEYLARTQPEFLESLIELADAEDLLKAERKRRCDGRILCRK